MIPKGLNDNIVYLAGKFSKAFQDKMQHAFKQAGFNITSEQFTILALLWYKDGLRQQEIAESIDRDKTTVSRVLNTMIKQDLIRRIPGSDKRERLIHLTKKGKMLRDRLVTISGNLYMKVIAEIPRTSLEKGIEILTQMNKNLG